MGEHMEVIFNEIKIKGAHRSIDDRSLYDFIGYIKDALVGMDDMEYYVPDCGTNDSLFDVIVLTHEHFFLFSLLSDHKTYWKINLVDLSAIKEEAREKDITFTLFFGSGNNISIRDSPENVEVVREFVNTMLDLSRIGLGIQSESEPSPSMAMYQEDYQSQRYAP